MESCTNFWICLIHISVLPSWSRCIGNPSRNFDVHVPFGPGFLIQSRSCRPFLGAVRNRKKDISSRTWIDTFLSSCNPKSLIKFDDVLWHNISFKCINIFVVIMKKLLSFVFFCLFIFNLISSVLLLSISCPLEPMLQETWQHRKTGVFSVPSCCNKASRIQISCSLFQVCWSK